jgi:hypothetical protein
MLQIKFVYQSDGETDFEFEEKINQTIENLEKQEHIVLSVHVHLNKVSHMAILTYRQ